MRNCAEQAALTTANDRFGSRQNMKDARGKFNDQAEDFKKKASDHLSNSTCEDIKWMFWNAAWAAANERKGYGVDGGKNKEKMEEHYSNIVGSNEMTTYLADNIKWMGWNYSWYWVNTLSGNHNDAQDDKERYEDHFNELQA